ncbi:DUF6993 domain-containing protein [Arthrobacter sp. G119Y2]|uniref:DUF6993 domain-containing protein n=1 Tax=Arthrobacter sp. G119Y2 TaxID=3134965 RepID=UPI003119A503
MIRAPRSRRPLLTLTVLLAGSAALLAPAAVPATSGTSTPVEAAALAVPALPPVPVAAEVSADALTTTLTALAASKPSPNRDEISRAFTDAGFTAGSVEVSLDRTPTGLAVDSIRGAAAQGDTCLFGEVREGQVSVSALPVLESGYCFVGDQR